MSEVNGASPGLLTSRRRSAEEKSKLGIRIAVYARLRADSTCGKFLSGFLSSTGSDVLVQLDRIFCLSYCMQLQFYIFLFKSLCIYLSLF